MGIIGGVLILVGIMGLFEGMPGFIIAIIIGWIMMKSELNEINKKNNSSNHTLKNEDDSSNHTLKNEDNSSNHILKNEDNSSNHILKNEENKSTNNIYIKSNNVKSENNSNNQKPMEVYVIVRFDNYPKLYTYLAPTNRFLKSGERVRIRTSAGEIKYVTVVKGNHKCPVKTDMHYSRLNIV